MTCDLARRNCDRDATHDVTITDPGDDPTPIKFTHLERECCDRHVGWYRQTYEDRGYNVEITPK